MRISFIVFTLFLTSKISFSQKFIFELEEKRTHYLNKDGSEAKFYDSTEFTNSTLIFDLKDSVVSIKNNDGIYTTKLTKISKDKNQYFFQTIGQYAIDPSKNNNVDYMIDYKNRTGRQKYISFCLNDMWHVTDFKGKVSFR